MGRRVSSKKDDPLGRSQVGLVGADAPERQIRPRNAPRSLGRPRTLAVSTGEWPSSPGVAAGCSDVTTLIPNSLDVNRTVAFTQFRWQAREPKLSADERRRERSRRQRLGVRAASDLGSCLSGGTGGRGPTCGVRSPVAHPAFSVSFMFRIHQFQRIEPTRETQWLMFAVLARGPGSRAIRSSEARRFGTISDAHVPGGHGAATACPSMRGFVTLIGASAPGRYHCTSAPSALKYGRAPSGSAASASGQGVRWYKAVSRS